MSQLLNDTLSAWLLIESLSPGEVNFYSGRYTLS
ncbi:Superfamily I DNA/RNA helicase protein [Staphylococcus aureus]|nr:Superfamily I DNA/RNA helicase protein [Staphylococcus aureus]